MKKIQELYQNNKRKIAIFALLLLIIAASFGLGYLLAKDANRAPILIENRI